MSGKDLDVLSRLDTSKHFPDIYEGFSQEQGAVSFVMGSQVEVELGRSLAIPLFWLPVILAPAPTPALPKFHPWVSLEDCGSLLYVCLCLHAHPAA